MCSLRFLHMSWVLSFFFFLGLLNIYFYPPIFEILLCILMKLSRMPSMFEILLFGLELMKFRWMPSKCWNFVSCPCVSSNFLCPSLCLPFVFCVLVLSFLGDSSSIWLLLPPLFSFPLLFFLLTNFFLLISSSWFYVPSLSACPSTVSVPIRCSVVWPSFGHSFALSIRPPSVVRPHFRRCSVITWPLFGHHVPLFGPLSAVVRPPFAIAWLRPLSGHRRCSVNLRRHSGKT